jgi:conserved hypothetical integral membrane protein
MSNEILIVTIILIDLALVLFAFRLGVNFLISIIIANLLLVSVTAPKVGSAFGFVLSPQSIFYASIFLGTDLLSEFHGKKTALKAVWGGFIALIVLAILSQLSIMFTPIEPASAFGEAMNTTLGATWRIALASFVAYGISQNLDVWLFHFIKEKTGGKKLWLRNNLSTMISQFVDTIIFFPIAFFGVMPEIVQVMITAYIIKLIVAFFDTPFMYLGKMIKK